MELLLLLGDLINGFLSASKRCDTGTIIITEDDKPEQAQKTTVYALVCSTEHNSKPVSQAEPLLAYCAVEGWNIHNVVKEIGTGFNSNRSKLLKPLVDTGIMVRI